MIQRLEPGEEKTAVINTAVCFTRSGIVNMSSSQEGLIQMSLKLVTLVSCIKDVMNSHEKKESTPFKSDFIYQGLNRNCVILTNIYKLITTNM